MDRHHPDRLGSGWAQLIGMFGRYQTTGEVIPVRAGDGIVVDVPPHFEAGEIPVHGAGGYNRWLPKSIGLAFWPVLGVVAYLIILVTGHSQQVHGSPAVGLSIALGVMLVAQVGALARARSRASGGS